MWHTIWDVPVFAGIQDKFAEIQDKIKDSPTLTKEFNRGSGHRSYMSLCVTAVYAPLMDNHSPHITR